MSTFRNKRPVISIDGTAGSGKGTLAKKLSKSISFDHLDTGLLYRYLSHLKLQKKLESFETQDLLKLSINISTIKRLNLRTELIGKESSIISGLKSVRSFLLIFQRSFADNPPSGEGSVIDGRDIGSVVVPNAEVKFFIDANLKLRAKRRLEEIKNLKNKTAASFKTILSQMRDRDNRDRKRSESPLIISKGSILIDTSQLTPDQVLKTALVHVKKILDNKTN